MGVYMAQSTAQEQAGPLTSALLTAANAESGRVESTLVDGNLDDVVRVGEWAIGWPSPGATYLLPHLVDTGQSRWVTDTDGLVFRIGITSREGRGRPANLVVAPEFKEPLWFADAIFVEGCGTRQNFFDKRTRFAAQTSAKCLELQVRWLSHLHNDVANGLPDHHSDARESWEHLLADTRVWLPVRHMMVLFVLPDALCDEAVRGVVLQSHEYLMSASSARLANSGGSTASLDRMVAGWSSASHLVAMM